jgi:hypothetical protein
MFILCTEILQEYHDNIFPGYENVLKNMTGFLSQIKIEKALFIFVTFQDSCSSYSSTYPVDNVD